MDVRYALGKPCSDGLLYPEHMSQIRPAVRVRGWFCLTELPADRLYARISASNARWGARSSYTPFSCKKPSKDEQPGPPFVLAMGVISSPLCSDVCRNWRLPEYEIFFAAARSWRVIPKEKLAWFSIILYTEYMHTNTPCGFHSGAN